MKYKVIPTFVKNFIQHYEVEIEQKLENEYNLQIDIPNAIISNEDFEVLNADGIPFTPRNRAEKRKLKRRIIK